MPAFVLSEFLNAMRETIADNPTVVLLLVAVLVLGVGSRRWCCCWRWRWSRRVEAAHRLHMERLIDRCSGGY